MGDRGLKSSCFHACSGVPQGSVLGPLLFNMFIDDITSDIPVPCLLYADDIKLYQPITSLSHCSRLQESLDRVFDWCDRNRLTLNVSKCSVMSFHRKRDPIMFPYNLNGEILSRPNFVRDLGVLFDPQLSFSQHIDTIVSKCHKTMGFIIRNGRNFSCDTLIRLFNAYIRSRLEYASIIWSPTYAIYVNELERVQRKFLKFMAFKQDGSYPVVGYCHELLLQRFGTSSLERRRHYHSTMFLYKLLNNQIDCVDIVKRIPFATRRPEARHQSPFYLPFARTRAQQSSPLFSMCRNYDIVRDQIDIFNSSCREIKSVFFNTA